MVILCYLGFSVFCLFFFTSVFLCPTPWSFIKSACIQVLVFSSVLLHPLLSLLCFAQCCSVQLWLYSSLQPCSACSLLHLGPPALLHITPAVCWFLPMSVVTAFLLVIVSLFIQALNFLKLPQSHVWGLIP